MCVCHENWNEKRWWVGITRASMTKKQSHSVCKITRERMWHICIHTQGNHRLSHNYLLTMKVNLSVCGFDRQARKGLISSLGKRMSWNALPHRCLPLNGSCPLAYMLWNYPQSSCFCNPYIVNLTICLFVHFKLEFNFTIWEAKRLRQLVLNIWWLSDHCTFSSL